MIKRTHKIFKVIGELDDLSSLISQIIIKYGDQMTELKLIAKDDLIEFTTMKCLN